MRQLGFVVLACLLASCSSVQLSSEANNNLNMAQSSVQIHLNANITIILRDGTSRDIGWRVLGSGSGVVYDKTVGVLSPVHSRILTANHVLYNDMAPGSSFSRFDGSVIKFNAFKFSLITQAGVECSLEPLVYGVDDTRDVAIGEADCDAGTIAPIASFVPLVGSRVVAIGYPLGVFPVTITEGFVSGWDSQGYLQHSAPIAPGNSGGPLFYNGKVIGLNVRGYEEYAHLSLSVPLIEIYKRIREANGIAWQLSK